MTNDYWEFITTEDDVIRNLSVWAMSHVDLVDLVDIKSDVHWIQLRIIPDYIIPRFEDYRGFLESWFQSQVNQLKTIHGYFGTSEYSLNLGIDDPIIAITFGNSSPISPVIIDLKTRKLSVWVTDGATGKPTLVAGLSPVNYSRMLIKPESFPRFIRIAYLHEKGIYNYT